MEASTLPVTKPDCAVEGFPSLLPFLCFFVAFKLKKWKIQVLGAQSKDWGRAAFTAKASAVLLLSAMLNMFTFFVVNPI